MSQINWMSQKGYDKLKDDLEFLKKHERNRISLEIAQARDKGDLSENAEYHAAKDAQGLLEAKINAMENDLAIAQVLDETKIDTSKVVLFTNVKIQNTKNKKEVSYKLVAEPEANLKEKKISINSPLGQGLLGKQVGEVAKVETPGGLLSFKILDISL